MTEQKPPLKSSIRLQSVFGVFKRKRYIGFVVLLFLATLATGVAIFDLSTQFFSDGSGQAEGHALAELVDEALQRVPLPPIPDQIPEENSLAGTGEFGVHNSASQQYKRELIGTAPVGEALSSLRQCRLLTANKYKCYAMYFTKLTQTQSIETAFVELKTIYNDGDQFAIGQCHQLAHVIGRAATTLFPTVAEAYNYGDTFCWSGYYHGIMEAIISDMGVNNVPKQLNNICADLPGKAKYSFNYYNCVHGLGHGLMYIEGHDLFAALQLCDELNGSWENSACYGGVFMENVIANEVDHVSEFLKKDDLLYPCNTVAEPYKQQCYLMQTSYMLKEVHHDFAEVFSLCATVDSAYQNICYQSLGRDASGQSTSDPERTKASCLLGPDATAQSNCVVGAVKDFVSYHHSDVEALEFCNLLSTELQQTCVTAAENYYLQFSD